MAEELTSSVLKKRIFVVKPEEWVPEEIPRPRKNKNKNLE